MSGTGIVSLICLLDTAASGTYSNSLLVQGINLPVSVKTHLGVDRG